MLSSIRWKLIIMTVALMFIVMIAAGTFIIVSLRNNENRNAIGRLEATSAHIMNVAMKNRADEASFRAWFEANTLSESIEGNILTTDGRTIATSVVADENIGKYPIYDSAVIISALSGEAMSLSSSRKSADVAGYDHRWVEYAAPVFDGAGQLAYVIYTRLNADSIYTYVDQMTRTIALSLVISLAASLAVGAYFANTITVPIVMLTRKAKQFATGHLDGDIVINSNDEIGQMTESFNNMARDLTAKMNETNREKNKLEIVLYNMSDGVLAYDEAGRCIHYNNACQELLDIQHIDALTMPEMLARLGADVSGHEGDSWRDTALFANGRYLNAAFTPFKSPDGTTEGMIIVLQDVTKHIKLDNMRKEFVANVSHEFRTPISIIKGYAETLLDGALDERETAEQFLTTINNESDRMVRIADDLLDLSKLDSGKMELKLEPLDLVALLRENVQNRQIAAARSNRTVLIKDMPESALILADGARVNQVLNNIISNSLKYSGENARVTVSLEISHDYYRVYVQDNGIGIPKEDLRHIFERFYRVDKARSRAMGGTGLGLSIARQIMEAHGGKIGAYSEVDKGTTMILRFPKYKD